MPAVTEPGHKRGFIMPIGGAEDKTGDLRVLRRFVQICGKRPRISVIPTASARKDIGQEYRSVFVDMGAEHVDILHLIDREQCFDDKVIETLNNADGVFITGGKQMRLSTTLGGTPVAKLLRRMNADGRPVAGTSAGAAIIPEHMIASGEEGASPQEGMVSLAPGLGFTNKIMIDQHFRQRDRLGRLLTAISYNPFAVGVGVDEDTAALIHPDNVIEVVGSGSITIIDPAALRYTDVDEVSRGDAISLINLKLHVLTEGGRFDIESRTAHL
jgi:cyanophycinase